MKNRVNALLSIFFIVYIFAMSILVLTLKDMDFSDLENRTLAQKPTFSLEEIKSGNFAKKFEAYFSDQFPLRDRFIAIKSYCELALQKKDINGVYIAKGDYFIEKFNTPNLDLLNKNLNYINKFSKNINVSFMLVPSATKIFEDKLPPFATPYDEGIFIEKVNQNLSKDINFVPLLAALQYKKNEYIYYKTDHHWTTLGAYYGYVEFCNSIGISPIRIDAFKIRIASSDFLGSLFSKGNFTFATPDKLEIFKPKKDNPLKVQYVFEEKTSDTMYEETHLQKKDKYSVFLDNNHPMLVINSSIKNGKKLMLLKDSYANCFIPFLTNHFEEIHVLDMRFLNMPISQYVKANNIDDVLLLYNTHSFAKETSFSLLK